MNHDTQGQYRHPSFPEDIIPDESEMIVHTAPIRARELQLITLTAKAPQLGETPAQAAFRGSLSIALIGFMRDSMIFPDEAASAEWSSLEQQQDGTGRFSRHPSNQDTLGTTAYVREQTIIALDEMQHTRQVMGLQTTGNRIFQMDAQELSAHISVACSIANLEGQYNGHSPMLGMALDLAAANPDPNATSFLRLLVPSATATLIFRIRNSQN